jgi:hypothetical protein
MVLLISFDKFLGLNCALFQFSSSTIDLNSTKLRLDLSIAFVYINTMILLVLKRDTVQVFHCKSLETLILLNFIAILI